MISSSPIGLSSDEDALRQNTELIAWSPVAEYQGQVKRPDDAVAVEVHIAAVARPPEAQHQRQVERPDYTIAIDVSRALALVGDAVAVVVSAGAICDIACIGNRVVVAVADARDSEYDIDFPCGACARCPDDQVVSTVSIYVASGETAR